MEQISTLIVMRLVVCCKVVLLFTLVKLLIEWFVDCVDWLIDSVWSLLRS